MTYIIFIISIIGIIVNRSNILLVLILIETMLLSISINLILNSIINNNNIGQIYTLYIITVAAVESAIGLSIILTFYKLKGSISIKLLNLLKG
nr:NADH dehydrogenase subunit 4L [Praya sp.]